LGRPPSRQSETQREEVGGLQRLRETAARGVSAGRDLAQCRGSELRGDCGGAGRPDRHGDVAYLPSWAAAERWESAHQSLRAILDFS